ncbi:MAG: BMP family ABC transporter substrate-binding protein [Anaerolineales bacterium]
MKKPRGLYSSFVWLLVIALLAACGGPSAAADCASPEVFCVGLVTELGKIDDQALNQMAWEGAKKAQLKLGVPIQYIETVDSRDYDRNIAIFADAGYDLVITVGYAQKQATIDAARKYPQVDFIGVDQALDPDKALPQNLAGLSFAEDQMGFLAGALAVQMTKTGKIGAVCGPDSFAPAWRYCEGFKAGTQYIISPPEPTPTETPAMEAPPVRTPTVEGLPTDEIPTDEPTDEIPTDEPTDEVPTDEPTAQNISLKGPVAAATATHARTATATPARYAPATATRQGLPLKALVPTQTPTPGITAEVSVVYHNEIAFKDSLADPKWDAATANTMIDGGVDVIFGADSYGENGAVSAAAKRRKYAIGVNTDQFLTLPDAQDMLLSSAMKEVTTGVFELIKAAKNGYFPGGDFPGKVGYAPFHSFESRIPADVEIKLTEIQQGLADGSIETGVSPAKP